MARVAAGHRVALAVRQVLEDRRHRVGLGVVGQPDARGQAGAVRQRDPGVVDAPDAPRELRSDPQGSSSSNGPGDSMRPPAAGRRWTPPARAGRRRHGDPADLHERHAHPRARRRVRARARRPRATTRTTRSPTRRRARTARTARSSSARTRAATTRSRAARARRRAELVDEAVAVAAEAQRAWRATAGGRALPAAARRRRRDPRARPRDGRGRDARDGQAAGRVDRRGRGGDRPHRDLLPPDRGARRLRGRARHAGRQRAQPQRAAPVRRLRGHRAVQLPRRARDRHERGGARRRQHDRPQAVRARAVVGRARRRGVRRCRTPARGRERRARRAGDRRGARASAIDGVVFTGSAEVGRGLTRRFQDGAFARPAITEMGGKNPAIVTAEADLDAAAEGIVASAFGFSGQKCSACSRAIVVDAVHDDLVERLAGATARARRRRPGRRRRLHRAR